MIFIPPYKLFSFIRYFHCYCDFFGLVGKWLDKKAKVNLKTFDDTTSIIGNKKTNTGQYLKMNEQG